MKDASLFLNSSLQRHENNFDFMRFVLASLVIVSHSPVLLDGNLDREPLYRLTDGHLTFGVVAVNGFFLLSGFLVLQSWQNSRGIVSYFLKRILRIYPGFIVATLLSVFVAGALGAADLVAYWAKFDSHYLAFIAKRILTLRVPPAPETFSGLTSSSVNGAIWTVRYEFVCYVALALLGLCGIYRKRFIVPLLTGLAFCTYVAQKWLSLNFSDRDIPLLGVVSNWPRFATYFLVGMCFHLYRDKCRFERGAALFSLAMVILGLLVPYFSRFALPTFGAYLFFFVGFSKAIPLHNFGRHGDFSYGIFLYGWPVTQLVLWYGGRQWHPAFLCLAAFVGALGLAFLSWHSIEKPCLSLKQRVRTDIRKFPRPACDQEVQSTPATAPLGSRRSSDPEKASEVPPTLGGETGKVL